MSESQEPIKFPVLQVLGGFIFVMAVGFLIVALSGKSEKEQEQSAMLFQGYQLTQYGTQICSNAVNEKTGSEVISPNETKGDRVNYVTLIWRNSEFSKAPFKEAACTYEKSKGIVSLVIDGTETI